MNTRTRIYRSGLTSFLTVCVVALFLDGCYDSKVVKPTSDSTPPSVMWKVLDKATNTNKEVTKSGNSMPLDKNGDYLATCFARDPQGIKRITLDVQGYLICSKLMSGGAISQKKGPFYSDSDTQNLAPDANNKVLTEIFIMRGVNSSALNGNDCGGGYEAVYTKAYIMKCTGENYLDLTTTSELTLDFE